MINPKDAAKICAICMISLSLTGCETLKTLFERKHDESQVAAGKYDVGIYNYTPSATEKLEEFLNAIPDKQNPDKAKGDVVKQSCRSAVAVAALSVPPASVGANNTPYLLFAPVAGILVASGFTFAVSEAEAGFAKYTDKRQKSFTATFDRSVNVAFLVSAAKPTFNCVFVSVWGKDVHAGDLPDFTFGAALNSSGATTPVAYQWIPTYFELRRSSARTDPSGALDVSVEIAINGATARGNQTLSDVTIALKNLCLSGGTKCDVGNSGVWKVGDKSKEPLGVDNASPWFVWSETDTGAGRPPQPCAGDCMPGSVRVTVIETGTGAVDYGTAKTELSNADKALTDAVGKIIDAKTKK